MEKEEEQNFILDFIEVYRSLPALWDIKSKDYANRDAKNAQYTILVTKYKERYPDADKTAVVKKINSLRTAYRKKVSDLERSGVGVDEESLPSLFYADALDFLNDTDKPRESRTSMASPMALGEVSKQFKLIYMFIFKTISVNIVLVLKFILPRYSIFMIKVMTVLFPDSFGIIGCISRMRICK